MNKSKYKKYKYFAHVRPGTVIFDEMSTYLILERDTFSKEYDGWDNVGVFCVHDDGTSEFITFSAQYLNELSEVFVEVGK